MEQDQIFAPATPMGGAIAVIRISGAGCIDAVQPLLTRTETRKQYPRRLSRVLLQEHGRPLDDAMAVCFVAPHSYTGEDMLELHCHGAQAVVRGVCAALSRLGLRPAEPGEFTRRAFLNGKLDLTQAEAVMDLIQSQADQSARAALEQMQGRLSADIHGIESLLYEALSALSAAMDYPEELDEDITLALPQQLEQAEEWLAALIAKGLRGRVLREGFRVVLVGAPNAGKSSLLNALLGYERAIVTAQAGTTRDTLEETLLLEGIPVRLTDTAGLREAKDVAEQQGVARARAAVAQADIALLLLDGSAALPADLDALLQEVAGKQTILLRTKSDLPAHFSDTDARLENLPLLPVSAKTGEGILALREAIRAHAGTVPDTYITNQRHVHALEQARAAVRQAQRAQDMDCASTDLRDALVQLGSITGRAVDERVVEEIFARFCVGK